MPHYSEAFYIDPLHGAANYWRERLWLISHFTGGVLALLVGRWQSFFNNFGHCARRRQLVPDFATPLASSPSLCYLSRRWRRH